MLREQSYSDDNASAYEYGFANVVKMLICQKLLYKMGNEECDDTYEKGHHRVVRLLMCTNYIDVMVILHGACNNGHTILVKMILDNNINIASDIQLLNGLLKQYCGHSFELVKLLISYGAYPDGRYETTMTTMLICKRYKTVRYFLTNYDLSQDEIDELTHLRDMDVSTGAYMSIFKILLAYGVNIDTAVWEIAYINNREITEALLKRGANIIWASNGAIDGGHFELFKTLFVMGGDPVVSYMRAYNCDNRDIMAYLLSYGLDKDALLIAASRLHGINLAEHALSLGANVHAGNNQPLRNAIANDNAFMHDILLRAGAILDF
jgi:hypothetical protein